MFVWTGATRSVLLTKHWAIKFPGAWASSPSIWWKHFLKGLLANMQEKRFSECNWPELCPVKFYILGGFLLVMPRVRVMTVDEFIAFDYDRFINKQDCAVPAERKFDSFGWLNGNIVAIDYGT